MKTIKVLASDDQAISLPKNFLSHLGAKNGESIAIDLSASSLITLHSHIHCEAQTIEELFSQTEEIEDAGDNETVQMLNSIRQILAESMSI